MGNRQTLQHHLSSPFPRLSFAPDSSAGQQVSRSCTKMSSCSRVSPSGLQGTPALPWSTSLSSAWDFGAPCAAILILSVPCSSPHAVFLPFLTHAFLRSCLHDCRAQLCPAAGRLVGSAQLRAAPASPQKSPLLQPLGACTQITSKLLEFFEEKSSKQTRKTRENAMA